MFENEIRVAGLKLLAEHPIQEGVEVSIAYARTQDPWASESRTWDIMAALKTSGTAARGALPAPRDLVILFRNEQDFPDDCKKKKVTTDTASGSLWTPGASIRKVSY
jgi:hypothetical protein